MDPPPSQGEPTTYNLREAFVRARCIGASLIRSHNRLSWASANGEAVLEPCQSRRCAICLARVLSSMTDIFSPLVPEVTGNWSTATIRAGTL